eukprot:1141927-Prorocentrum_minimum.AAC.3
MRADWVSFRRRLLPSHVLIPIPIIVRLTTGSVPGGVVNLECLSRGGWGRRTGPLFAASRGRSDRLFTQSHANADPKRLLIPDHTVMSLLWEIDEPIRQQRGSRVRARTCSTVRHVDIFCNSSGTVYAAEVGLPSMLNEPKRLPARACLLAGLFVGVRTLQKSSSLLPVAVGVLCVFCLKILSQSGSYSSSSASRCPRKPAAKDFTSNSHLFCGSSGSSSLRSAAFGRALLRPRENPI